ncbi:MAG TPA: DUF167 domain-containing protein [Conexibacter sp.]|nr:DUF167 domain-containing protein [Conexibacter sp.]
MELDVRVIPRAARDELAGMRGGRLLVRVTAPPLDGRANAAVCALVAKAAGVPKGAVRVVRGETARDKRLLIVGDEPAVRAALGLD